MNVRLNSALIVVYYRIVIGKWILRLKGGRSISNDHWFMIYGTLAKSAISSQIIILAFDDDSPTGIQYI